MRDVKFFTLSPTAAVRSSNFFGYKTASVAMRTAFFQTASLD